MSEKDMTVTCRFCVIHGLIYSPDKDNPLLFEPNGRVHDCRGLSSEGIHSQAKKTFPHAQSEDPAQNAAADQALLRHKKG